MELKNSTMRTSVVSITETSLGWILEWSSKDIKSHKTATDALNTVRQRDMILANAGINVITTITWTAYTNAGLIVIKALQ